MPGAIVMRRLFSMSVVAVAMSSSLLAGRAAVAADNYAYDPVHSSISFKVRHLEISYVHGRFNDASGSFTIDRNDPSKSSFELTIKADSIDSGNKGRDDHLRSGDFFDTKQFPTITFKSTSVKAAKAGYEVTGDFTMHGKTQKITFALEGGKEAEVMGMKKIGFSTELMIKRSDYAMEKKMIGSMLADDVKVYIDLEGIKK
jgi:polyisoprenoid-binding protein YceI